MKNGSDIKAELNLALIDWFNRQVKNPFADYYLYYSAATAEHEGALIVCAEQPPNSDFQLAWPERLPKGKTVDEVFTYLFERCVTKLPILSC